MSKYKEESELDISKIYLRENQDFSLVPNVKDENLELNKCNFFHDRKEGIKPTHIIVTNSVSPTLEAALAKMIFRAGQEISEVRKFGVSCHYIIDKDRKVYHLVPEDKKAWLAGGGKLKTGSILNPDIKDDMTGDAGDPNQHSVTIMYINNGNEEYTDGQKDAGRLLIQQTMDKYDIPPTKVHCLGDVVAKHMALGPYAYSMLEEYATKYGIGLWPTNPTKKENPKILISKEYLKEAAAGEPSEALNNLDHLFDQLGMCGSLGTRDPQGQEYTKTESIMSNMWRFKSHWSNEVKQDIENNPTFAAMYHKACKWTLDKEALPYLAEWNENNQLLLEDIVCPHLPLVESSGDITPICDVFV